MKYMKQKKLNVKDISKFISKLENFWKILKYILEFWEYWGLVFLKLYICSIIMMLLILLYMEISQLIKKLLINPLKNASMIYLIKLLWIRFLRIFLKKMSRNFCIQKKKTTLFYFWLNQKTPTIWKLFYVYTIYIHFFLNFFLWSFIEKTIKR